MARCFSVLILMVIAQSTGAVACRDFVNQEEAQRYHEEHGGSTRLDGDKDGEACECLPGGSAYGSPKCNRG